MAKFKPGPAIAEARGSVGGTVFSKNTYGMYMRNHTSPVQPQTPAQNAQRSGFTQASQRWRDTLTDAQRDAWKAYAEGTPLIDVFGDKQVIAPNAMYCRYNAVALRLGWGAVDDAPASPGEAAQAIPTIAGDTTNGIQLSAVSPSLSAGDHLVVQMSRGPWTDSKNFYNGPWEIVADVASDATFPVTLKEAAEVAEGQKWFYRVRLYTADGRVGPATIGSVVVAAGGGGG